jgi:hypothetical protein
MKPKKNIAARYSTSNISNGYSLNTIGSTINTINTTGSNITIGTSFGTSFGTSSGTFWAPYTTSPIFATTEVEVLGKKFEVSEDTFQKLYLAEIDFHGILFYKSLKKNSILIQDKNVKEYLEKLLQIEERDNKIKEIMKNL